MEFFVGLISSVIPYIKTAFLAIIPLGFLIFIHELGHFYAAKRCGIKVNTFSLGFGPKLIGFQRDETDYRISLLPFGGYVQMEGESPTEQTGAPGEFASAPLGSRALVVAAGPAVNLLFGVLIYWLVFATGINTDSARLIGGLTDLPLSEKEAIQIGWINDDGPGARGGLMPGDTIISVNGDPVSHWMMFQTWVVTSANKPLELLVERNDERKILSVKPDAEPSIRGDMGVIQVSSRTETIVSHVEAGSLAAQAGIQVGDQIESINGEKLHNVPYFGYGVWHASEDWRNEKYQGLYQRINGNQEALILGIRRGDETRTLELPVRWHVKASVPENSIAGNAGIQDGDVLVALNGMPIDNATLYSELKKMVGGPIEVDVVRDGIREKVILAAETQSSETDTESALFGLAWQTSLSGMEFDAKTAPLPDYNFFTSFEKGIEATWLTFTAVGKILERLVGGDVSPKQLTGPVGIANITSRMFDRVGLGSFLFFIGFISINLCIVNLLPIPIADGGQLLFFAVEKIRGRPMPRRAQELVQQVCIVFLIALFLYITWFDSISLIHDLRN